MTMDSSMKIEYPLVLKDLRRKLDQIESRRRALQAAIAGLEALVVQDSDDDEVTDLVAEGVIRARASRDLAERGKVRNPPAIPPHFFARKSPTEAYRLLMERYPGSYTPPQIADAFEAGGMKKSRTKLLQAIHSVLKRERERASQVESNGHGDYELALEEQ